MFYDVSNDALKQTVKDTYNLVVRYFKKLGQYPVRKSYKDKKKSFYVDPFKIDFTERKFRLLLADRIRKYDIKLIIANKYYPSTKKCSCCGNVKKMEIQDRVYVCDYCNLIINRDLNSAINLANYKK